MRMPTRSLGSLLAAVAATAVASTACKKTPLPVSAEDSSTPETSSSTATRDPTNWTLGEMKEVNATSPVEGITVYSDELDDQGKSREMEQMAVYGQTCSQVNADATSCQKLYQVVKEQQKAKRTVFAIVTRSDRFEVLTEQTALRALLGEIDTPMEAQLLASFAASSKIWSPQCTGFTRTIVMDKASPSGYSMKLQKRVRKGALKKPNEECTDCIIVEQRKAVVRPNGDVELTLPQESQWIRPTGCGRSPGWTCASTERARPRTAGEYLARAAHLEAASVAAFERIADELGALGAPEDLVFRARGAAIEEEGHARVMGELARAHGAEPVAFVAEEYELRSAFDLAVDNVIEGCVNETFGTLVLHVQALTAEDSVARRAFTAIAKDEARHAELSHDLANWLAGRLTPSERESVRRAATKAWKELCAALDQPALDDERELRRIGLPDATTARALYAELEGLR